MSINGSKWSMFIHFPQLTFGFPQRTWQVHAAAASRASLLKLEPLVPRLVAVSKTKPVEDRWSSVGKDKGKN